MASLSNTFEGGTQGVTITTANSGGVSGNAFDSVNIGTGGTCIYDNTHVHSGTLENEQALGATAGQVYVVWSTSLGSVTELYSRIYLYLTANPGATAGKIEYISGAAAVFLAISTTGKIGLINAASATVALSTNSITLNAWNRLEFHCIQNATTGTIQARLFFGSSVDSATPTESLDGGATNTGSSAYSAIRIGQTNNASNVTYWVGDVATSTTGWIGPVLNTYAVPISATSTSAVSISKNTGKNVAATSTSTTSIAKGVGTGVSAVSNSAVSIVKNVGKGIAATSNSAIAIGKGVGKTVSAASSSAASVLKNVGKTVSALSRSVASAVGSTTHITFGIDTSGRRTAAAGFENRVVVVQSEQRVVAAGNESRVLELQQEPRTIVAGDENRQVVA